MKTKETWIDETLNSLEGIGRASVSPDLFLKIHAKTEHPENKTVPLRRFYHWSVAAGVTILIALNIMGALHYQNTQTRPQAVPAALATEYLSYLGPIKL